MTGRSRPSGEPVRRWRGFGAALAAFAVAASLSWLLRGFLEPHVFLFFFVAIIVGASAGGVWPGLLVVALSAITIHYVFYEPVVGFGFAAGSDVVRQALLLLISLLVMGITALLREVRRKAYDSALELSASAGRLRAIVETAVDGVITADERGIIEAANPAAQRIFGYTEQELVGRNVSMLMPEPDRSQHDHYIRSYLETGFRKIIGMGREVLALRKDGTVFPMYLAVGEARLPDRVIFTGIMRDVTEQKRAAEELLAAKERAEAASRAKSNFLAVMSHELRTPLAGIIGYADLLETQVSGPVSEKQRQQLRRIKAGAWHLVSVIDGILAFSRFDAGMEEVRVETADGVALARDAVVLVQPQADAKQLELRAELPAEPVLMETDAGKLRQILLNLLGNAVKFTEQGLVELKLGVDEAGWASFSVRDDGPGIPPEERERIFEPFMQVEQPNTRAKGGTGLGLTVSRSLARLLGGDLFVDSEAGSGSTFTARIPLRSPPPGESG